jgi:hypothetical protein
MARLVSSEKRTKPRELGFITGEVAIGPEFDDPLPDEMMRASGGQLD